MKSLTSAFRSTLDTIVDINTIGCGGAILVLLAIAIGVAVVRSWPLPNPLLDLPTASRRFDITPRDFFLSFWSALYAGTLAGLATGILAGTLTGSLVAWVQKRSEERRRIWETEQQIVGAAFRVLERLRSIDDMVNKGDYAIANNEKWFLGPDLDAYRDSANPYRSMDRARGHLELEESIRQNILLLPELRPNAIGLFKRKLEIYREELERLLHQQGSPPRPPVANAVHETIAVERVQPASFKKRAEKKGAEAWSVTANGQEYRVNDRAVALSLQPGNTYRANVLVENGSHRIVATDALEAPEPRPAPPLPLSSLSGADRLAMKLQCLRAAAEVYGASRAGAAQVTDLAAQFERWAMEELAREAGGPEQRIDPD